MQPTTFTTSVIDASFSSFRQKTNAGFASFVGILLVLAVIGQKAVDDYRDDGQADCQLRYLAHYLSSFRCVWSQGCDSLVLMGGWGGNRRRTSSQANR